MKVPVKWLSFKQHYFNTTLIPEAKLVSSPPIKKTTSAPAPISPVTARSAGVSAYDTTDPRSTKAMTDSQWIEAERKRQIKKWEAQNR